MWYCFHSKWCVKNVYPFSVIDIGLATIREPVRPLCSCNVNDFEWEGWVQEGTLLKFAESPASMSREMCSLHKMCERVHDVDGVHGVVS